MKRIGLFLTSGPSAGGMFQYSLALLSAMLALPKDEYSIVVAYVDAVWIEYLQEQRIVLLPIAPSRVTKILAKLWIASGASLDLWRRLTSSVSPTAKSILKSGCDSWVFPVQDFWPSQFSVPRVVAMHDLMHRYESRFPEVSGYGRFRFRDTYLADICSQAIGILVDSNLGMRQVHESYGIPQNRIFVLPYVIPEYVRDYVPAHDFDDRYALPSKYLFYPAQFWPHKNHLRLVQAVAMIKQEIPDIRVVLSGSKKKQYSRIVASIKDLGLQSNFVFLGYVPDLDMPELYARARALIMPTFFGPTNIPPLEAFSLGCPVAISGIYAMPEQVGDAALQFDPNSVEEIACCIRRLWSDDELCRKLALRGKERTMLWNQDKFNLAFTRILAEILKEPVSK
jgi:glycosyltransferase involved in cell wall biosynthesis